MGIHSDSIYKDTQREVEAKKVDTEQVVGKDAEGNIFAKIEDTADGGQISLFGDGGTKLGELFISANDRLRVDNLSPGQGVIIRTAGDGGLHVKDETLKVLDTVNVNNNIIVDPQNVVANDNMTANPETDTEDGYIKVDIGGTIYQIPIYLS